MDLENLVIERMPPQNRVGKATSDTEQHLYEGAVMLAYAMHLLRTEDTAAVRIHPDGEHGKQFDFTGWLAAQGFARVSAIGTTTYGGVYRNDCGQEIEVNPKSGVGDVVAEIGDLVLAAECKGGVINTRHAGQVSRLRKGLCETVGLLMATPSKGRQVAVVPHTEVTLRLANKMAPRCAAAGIGIALIGSRGEVFDVSATDIAT